MKANEEIETMQDAFEMWYAETYPQPNPTLKALALRAWGNAWMVAMDRYIAISANETMKAVQAGIQDAGRAIRNEATTQTGN